MATHHGKEGTVKVGANTVAEIKSFSLDRTSDTVEDTAMGDSMKSYVVGQGDATGSITCHFDETDTSGQGAMTQGASVSLALYPEGADSGDTYYTMTAIINSLGISVDMGSIVERSFGFQVTGGVTETTV
tara:strand:- start:103 stop:492 length:390 start_codon:yes stop_codon:yes gene_type:complete